MRVVAQSTIDGIVWCTELADTDPEISQEPTEVMIGIVAPVDIGDILLVHAGTALLKLPATPDRASAAGAQ